METEISDPAPRSPSREIPVIRLLLAVAVTVGVLIYGWGRSLVVGIMSGQPERPFVWMAAGGVLAVIALTWKLSPRLPPRLDRAVLRGMPIAWIAINGVLIALFAGDLIPRLPLGLLFVAASLGIGWLAWMFYRPWTWKVRVGGLVVGVLLALLFPVLVKVNGLTGEPRVNFAWRFVHQADPGSNLPTHSTPPVDERPDLARTTADDWPQFLGPARSGIATAARLDRDWQNKPPREVWRKSVGAGWSSFAIVGDFAVTQEQRGAEESVVCYRVADGKEMWVHSDPGRFESSMGGPGPRATPTIVEGRVYTVGATGILNCLDGRTGDAIWTKDILKDNAGGPIAHGVCGSPLIAGNQVIVSPTNGPDGICLAAYDRLTGNRLWQGGRHQASYGSPALANLLGTSQVLLYTDDGMAGHDLETGRALWDYPWTNHVRVNCSQPLVIDGPAGQVLVSTNYGTGSVLLQISRFGENWSAEPEKLMKGEMKTKFTTAVRLGNCIYGLDEGILACVDLTTGKRRWKGGRYQHGQVLLSGDLLIVQAENGEVVLVQLDPGELIEVGKVAALTGKTWNNPALTGKFLLVRNDHEAACYELPIVGE